MALHTSAGSSARYARDNRAARLVRTAVQLTAASLAVFVVGLTLATGSAAAATGDFGPLFAIGGDSSGVSCSDAVDCTAVGLRDFAVTESGGVWGSPAVLSGHPGDFTGVSCTAAGNCTAVGISSDTEAGMIYATESAGTWGAVNEIPFPPNAQGGQIRAVSCTGAGDCTAVGVDGDQTPVHVTETDGTWGPMIEATAPSSYDEFLGVSCPAVGECTAVGVTGSGGVFTLRHRVGRGLGSCYHAPRQLYRRFGERELCRGGGLHRRWRRGWRHPLLRHRVRRIVGSCYPSLWHCRRCFFRCQLQ